MDQKAYEISFLVLLEFTPLEFETGKREAIFMITILEFTPLEFETSDRDIATCLCTGLEFTPLEFETKIFFLKVHH